MFRILCLVVVFAAAVGSVFAGDKGYGIYHKGIVELLRLNHQITVAEDYGKFDKFHGIMTGQSKIKLVDHSKQANANSRKNIKSRDDAYALMAGLSLQYGRYLRQQNSILEFAVFLDKWEKFPGIKLHKSQQKMFKRHMSYYLDLIELGYTSLSVGLSIDKFLADDAAVDCTAGRPSSAIVSSAAAYFSNYLRIVNAYEKRRNNVRQQSRKRVNCNYRLLDRLVCKDDFHKRKAKQRLPQKAHNKNYISKYMTKNAVTVLPLILEKLDSAALMRFALTSKQNMQLVHSFANDYETLQLNTPVEHRRNVKGWNWSTIFFENNLQRLCYNMLVQEAADLFNTAIRLRFFTHRHTPFTIGALKVPTRLKKKDGEELVYYDLKEFFKPYDKIRKRLIQYFAKIRLGFIQSDNVNLDHVDDYIKTIIDGALQGIAGNKKVSWRTDLLVPGSEFLDIVSVPYAVRSFDWLKYFAERTVEMQLYKYNNLARSDRSLEPIPSVTLLSKTDTGDMDMFSFAVILLKSFNYQLEDEASIDKLGKTKVESFITQNLGLLYLPSSYGTVIRIGGDDVRCSLPKDIVEITNLPASLQREDLKKIWLYKPTNLPDDYRKVVLDALRASQEQTEEEVKFNLVTGHLATELFQLNAARLYVNRYIEQECEALISSGAVAMSAQHVTVPPKKSLSSNKKQYSLDEAYMKFCDMCNLIAPTTLQDLNALLLGAIVFDRDDYSRVKDLVRRIVKHPDFSHKAAFQVFMRLYSFGGGDDCSILDLLKYYEQLIGNIGHMKKLSKEDAKCIALLYAVTNPTTAPYYFKLYGLDLKKFIKTTKLYY